jgi:putative transposase
VTLCIDAYSRLLLGWAIALVPSAAAVLTALRMGVLIDPARGDFGGLPRTLRPDRGLEFMGEGLAQVCAVLGIQLLPAPRYSPHLKGKVERVGRTLAQDFLCTPPFYTDGPRDKTGAVVRTWYWTAHARAVRQRFRRLGCGLQHASSAYEPGRSDADRTLARRRHAPAHRARGRTRFLLLPSQSRKVVKDGIHFGGVRFIAPELNGRVGQTVEVRAMPHDLRRIEVFVGGRWLASAYPQATLSAEQRAEVLRRRKADAVELARRHRRASRLARVQIAPLVGRGPVEDTSVMAATTARIERQRGDDEALRRLARTDLLGLERRRRSDGPPLP